MTLDEEVLAQTKEIRERLLESERALEHLRADYHHAIRLLHARGGNMREIAEALVLSHQRVHQIVGADVEGPEGHGRHGGPGRGRRHDYRRGPFLRFTADGREAIVRASGAARELSHGAVEAPHILLALAELDAFPGSGVDAQTLRERVAAAYPAGPHQRRGRMRLGHSAKEVIEAADRAAGESHVDVRGLAVALTEPDSQARESIASLGVDLDRIRGTASAAGE